MAYKTYVRTLRGKSQYAVKGRDSVVQHLDSTIYRVDLGIILPCPFPFCWNYNRMFLSLARAWQWGLALNFFC